MIVRDLYLQAVVYYAAVSLSVHPTLIQLPLPTVQSPQLCVVNERGFLLYAPMLHALPELCAVSHPPS